MKLVTALLTIASLGLPAAALAADVSADRQPAPAPAKQASDAKTPGACPCGASHPHVAMAHVVTR